MFSVTLMNEGDSLEVDPKIISHATVELAEVLLLHVHDLQDALATSQRVLRMHAIPVRFREVDNLAVFRPIDGCWLGNGLHVTYYDALVTKPG